MQHVEMAGDIAASFNHIYGEHFTLPQAAVDDTVATLPGLDGRKTSKSYNNTIPLFAPRDELRRLIFSLVTDSTPTGALKKVEGSALLQIYQAFASDEETAALRQAYADGIAWADAKQMLFERVDAEIGPIRKRYEALVGNPAELERILQSGARKIRARTTPFLKKLRRAVGLRSLVDQPAGKQTKAGKPALPPFKQYRDSHGRHYVKLLGGDGSLLLQSVAFDSPQEAGRVVAALKMQGIDASDGTAHLPAGTSESDVRAALSLLAS